MQTVLERAVVRGEIDPDRLSPPIASLPLDLVRHVIMKQSALPDPALVEIVDKAFMPLPDAKPATTSAAVSLPPSFPRPPEGPFGKA
jgi:hypothetical protein